MLGTVLRPARRMSRSCGHPGATKVPSGPLFGLSLKGGRSFRTHQQLKKLERPHKSMDKARSCASVRRNVAGCCRQGRGLLLGLRHQPGSSAAGSSVGLVPVVFTDVEAARVCLESTQPPAWEARRPRGTCLHLKSFSCSPPPATPGDTSLPIRAPPRSTS